MSTTSNLQIDSTFRDIAKYPLCTDFSVKFRTSPTLPNTPPNVLGVPTTTGGYQTALSIDPDFVNADFNVTNGTLSHLDRTDDGAIYISGLINNLAAGTSFKITQGAYTIITIPTTFNVPSAYIAKVIPVGSSYYMSWFYYLCPNQASGGIFSANPKWRSPPTRSTLRIDDVGTIWWMFDCSYDEINIINFQTNATFYTIKSPSGDSTLFSNQPPLRQNNIITAFNADGTRYQINQHAYGYHLLSSTNDLLPSAQNGRFNVETNVALDLYTTTNTNPLDPYVYFTSTQETYNFTNSYFLSSPTSLMAYNGVTGAMYSLSAINNFVHTTFSAGFYALYPGYSYSSDLYINTIQYVQTGAAPITYVAQNFADAYGDGFPIQLGKFTSTGVAWYFEQNVVYDVDGIIRGTRSPFTLLVYGAYLYLIIWSITDVYHGYDAQLLIWRTNHTTLSGSSTWTNIVNDTNFRTIGYEAPTAIVYNNQIVVFAQNAYYQSIAGNLCASVAVYNPTTTAYHRTDIVTIPNLTYTLSLNTSLSFAFTKCWIDTNNQLQGIYTQTNDGGIVLITNVSSTSDATITLSSRLNIFGSNAISAYVSTTTGKTYLYAAVGSITDVTNATYPYQLTNAYPVKQDALQLLANKTANKNLLITEVSSAATGPLGFFVSEFIDATSSLSTVTSSHYTTTSTYYSPNTLDMTLYCELFAIPASTSSSNSTNNFTPAQFINNGLLGWYNASSVATTGFSKAYRFNDLSGNLRHLVAPLTDFSALPTYFNVSNNMGYVRWDLQFASQNATFSTTGSSFTNVKYVIASYSASFPVGTETQLVNLIQFSSGASTYDALSFDHNTGTVGMWYQDGSHTTTFNTSSTFLNNSSALQPIMFGYNINEGLGPNVIWCPDSSLQQGGQSAIVSSFTNYVESSSVGSTLQVMFTTGTGMKVYLQELIVLDFIPTDYQLSLFNTYFIRNNTTPVANPFLPPLASYYPYLTPPLPNLLPPKSGVFKVGNLGTSLSISNVADSQPLATSVVNSQHDIFYLVRYLRLTTVDAQPLSPNVLWCVTDNNSVGFYNFDDNFFFNGVNIAGDNKMNFVNVGPPANFLGSKVYQSADGNVYGIVSTFNENDYSNKCLYIFKAIFDGNGYIVPTQVSFLNIPDPTAYLINPWQIWCFEPYTYVTTGKTYLFLNLCTARHNAGDVTEYSVFQVYDITTEGSITLLYEESLDDIRYAQGSTTTSTSIVQHPTTNKLYYVFHARQSLYVWDITDPLNAYRTVVNGLLLRSSDTYGTVNGYNWLTNASAPCKTYVNPLTKQVVALQSTAIYNSAVSDYKYYIGYNDITDLNNNPGTPIFPQQFLNNDGTLIDASGQICSDLRVVTFGQSVYMLALTSPPNATITHQWYTDYNGSFMVDISNIEFTFTYYSPSVSSYLTNTTTFNNFNGIGYGLVHKIDNQGYPRWMSSIGGVGDTVNSQWGYKINISNSALDTSLRYMYVAGGWVHKIETFVNSLFDGTPQTPVMMNECTSYLYDNTVNAFIAKVNIADGTFVWLTPTLGSNDDFFERIAYISDKNSVALVSHFSSPVMVVYEPQLSQTTSVGATGVFINPINSVLNVGNSSSVTSALFLLNTDGVFQWVSRLYSTEQNISTSLYDLYRDGDKLWVIGISNANTLRCVDGAGVVAQNLYANSWLGTFDTLSQQMMILYAFDLNGAYIQSNRIVFPPNTVISVNDVKSFKLFNRVVVFPNYMPPVATDFYMQIYNKDGSIGTTIYLQPTTQTTNFATVISYQYDSTYTDVANGKNYSRIQMYNTTAALTAQSLTNFYLYIQGSISSTTTDGGTIISSDPVLNRNFSIRSGSYDAANSVSTIILNQIIDVKNIVRTGLPFANQLWSGSVSETQLYAMISYTQSSPGSPTYVITQIFGSIPPVVSGTGAFDYYIVYPNSGNGANLYVQLSAITLNNGIYRFTTAAGILIDNNAMDPYAYLCVVNKSAGYTLQYYPGSILTSNYFTVTLQSLTMPDRALRDSNYKDLSEMQYIFMLIVNTNDAGDVDPQILNNFFSDNINRPAATIFTIPTNGAGGGGGNFTTLSSGLSAQLKFSPGYYNLRTTLLDPDGKVLVFDNTSTKTSDAGYSTAPFKLMNMSYIMTVTKTAAP